MAANVLVGDADGYVFRHELIREAVLGDLLPGERAQAHRRFAERLEAAPSLGSEGSVAIQVARHWRGAREVEGGLIAAWRAAAIAGVAFAYAEQLMMLEQVLELWDQVDDPARAPMARCSHRLPGAGTNDSNTQAGPPRIHQRRLAAGG